MRCLRTTVKNNLHLPQLEKACAQQRRPNAAKKIFLNKNKCLFNKDVKKNNKCLYEKENNTLLVSAYVSGSV